MPLISTQNKLTLWKRLFCVKIFTQIPEISGYPRMNECGKRYKTCNFWNVGKIFYISPRIFIDFFTQKRGILKYCELIIPRQVRIA